MADLPFLQDQGGPPSQNIDFAVSILDQGQPAPDVPWDAEQSIDINQTLGQLFQQVEHSGCFSGRAEHMWICVRPSCNLVYSPH